MRGEKTMIKEMLFFTTLMTLVGCQGAVNVAEKINKTLTFRDFEVYKTGAYYCVLNLKENKNTGCHKLLVRIQDDKSFASLTIDLYEGIYYFADVNKSEIDEWIKYTDDFVAWQPKDSRDFVIKEANKKRTHELRLFKIPEGTYPVEFRFVDGKKELIVSGGNETVFGIDEEDIKTLKELFISLKSQLK